MDAIRIGNACGFWGDSPEAPLRLVQQAFDLDVLTLDYLAEVSMSILAKQKRRNPELGYPRDLLDVIRSLVPIWKSGRKLKLVTNGGGLNPTAAAHASAKILGEAGCALKIGVITGDDVLSHFQNSPQDFPHLETGALPPQGQIFTTANAYLGAAPLLEAINPGADLVIAGRVADPSLTVAPCAAHFGWTMNDFNHLASATVAGHLIECGTQVTGGISTHWMDLRDSADIGYPIVEVSSDGSCIVTKPYGTGGEVSVRTVKEQLLYEIGDPANYLSPDATVSFTSLDVAAVGAAGADRVRVSGATGRAPSEFYKVSATYPAGWRCAATLTVIGRDAVAKARRAGQAVLDKLARTGGAPGGSLVECLGSGDGAVGLLGRRDDLNETVLRIAVRDLDRSVVERFAREVMPLVTGGPQGITGYAEGRPEVREVFGYWPTLIPRDQVRARVEMIAS